MEMRKNFVLSTRKLVRKIHSHAVKHLYISIGKKIKASSMEEEKKQMTPKLYIWATDQEGT